MADQRISYFPANPSLPRMRAFAVGIAAFYIKILENGDVEHRVSQTAGFGIALDEHEAIDACRSNCYANMNEEQRQAFDNATEIHALAHEVSEIECTKGMRAWANGSPLRTTTREDFNL